MGDLAGGADRDVDPVAFEQAHMGAVEVACFGETFLLESLRRWRPPLPNVLETLPLAIAQANCWRYLR